MLVGILLSFIAGVLTILAPCALPMVPLIVGGSVAGARHDRWRPYVITASLVVSLIVFTLILKISTSLIGIDPRVWAIGSGVLIMLLGIVMLFPSWWVKIVSKFGIEHRSQSLLAHASFTSNSTLSAILIGAALGPVFSSCSPTYAWVIATVIPANLWLGLLYLLCYCIGLAAALLAVALVGRRLVTRLRWASNPRGWLQRIVAIVFIVVGMTVATGLDKTAQAYIVERDPLQLLQFEQTLVPAQ